jgi:hypothetical protein
MSDVEVSYLKEEARPAFLLNDVKGADFFRVRAQRATGVPTFVLNNVTDFSAQQCGPVPDTRLEHIEAKKL